MDYSNLHLPLIILMAFLTVLVWGAKLGSKTQRLFLLYLGVNFFVESIANILDYNGKSNLDLYNAGMIFEISFFLYIFRRNTANYLIKKAILISVFFFLLIASLDIILLQKKHSFLSNAYTVGCFLLMGASLYFLFLIVIKSKHTNPLKNFLFWFSIGVLFCYLGNLPYLSVINRLFATDNKLLARNLAIISLVVNTLLYVLIIIGNICHKKAER